MASSGRVPFGSLIDFFRNQGDDDFESDFDETYGDSNGINNDDTRTGLTLIWMGVLFLFVLVLLRYCCLWFIDHVIMCERCRNPRNNEGFVKRNLSRCCPRWFPAAPSEGDAQGLSNHHHRNSTINDDPTAANSSDHSNSSSGSSNISESSNDEGLEMVESKSSIEEQKRNIFVSLLNVRTATQDDILEGREEQAVQQEEPLESSPPNSSEGAENAENATTAATESMVVPDGSPQEIADGETICCPICIQEIKVGDQVHHCKHCHHLFHLECTLEWLATGSTLCPYCRREIFTRSRLEEAYRKQQGTKHPGV